MEKRVILAFVLSVVVYVGFMLLFPQQRPVTPPAKKPDLTENKETVPGTPDVAATAAATTGTVTGQTNAPEVPAAVPTREITVDTPLYQAVFSNNGPTIKSFRLKKYRQTIDPASGPVDLIDLKSATEHALEVSFTPSTVQNPQQRIYLSDSQEETIRLEPGSAPRTLTFITETTEHVLIEQAFTVYADQYPVDLLVTARNNSTGLVEGRLDASLKNQVPTSKKSYAPFNGAALLLNNKLETIEVNKLAKETKNFSGKIGWIAYENGYFINAVIPAETDESRFQGQVSATGIIKSTYTAAKIAIPAGAKYTNNFTLYLGPRDLQILKTLGKKLEVAINFGWVDILAKPLLYALRFFNQYVHNYGIAIIIMTILIKILFWPLTHKSYHSMKDMQKLQPLMAKIREKYKDNKEQLNKEMMGLYRTYKINPLGGCLPMVIQIPVFFALYRLLGDSIELRHAPFMLWIQDLSAPDRLFTFTFSIPYMAPPYGIPVMTLLMGASMFIQQKLTPSPGDPMQAKMMLFLPVIFTFFFINFPSGLVLYWLVNNVLSIGQQYQIMKKAKSTQNQSA